MRLAPMSMILVWSVGLISPVAQGSVSFTESGFWVVQGEPRLILGLYELPEDDAVLQSVADAGFTMVRGRPERATLDRIAAHGLRAWIPLSAVMALPENDAEAEEELDAVIREFKEHPALLCWEAPDESLWNEWYSGHLWFAGEQVRQLRDRIKQAGQTRTDQVQKWNADLERAIELGQRALWKDSEAAFGRLWTDLGATNPHPELNMTVRAVSAQELGRRLTRGWQYILERDAEHVLWQNHAPRNAIADLRLYNQAVHAAGCDIYPVPFNRGGGHSDLKDTNLTAVGAYTERMRQGAPGKACWMVLQGFGWRDLKEPGAPKDEDGRRPHFKETRFMAWDALLHGANALLYWGTFAIEKDSSLWRDLLRIAKELRALEPAIVAPEPDSEPVVNAELNASSFDGGQPMVWLRQAGDEWVLIAVNEANCGVAFEVAALPAALEGKTFYRLYSGEEHEVEDGRFRDGIRELDVHVYATSRKFEAH